MSRTRRRKKRIRSIGYKPSTHRMRRRILCGLIGFVFFSILLVSRIVYLNRHKGDDYTKKKLAQQSHMSGALPYKRGDIIDTHGNRLATSIKVYNLFLDPLAILQEDKYRRPTLDALQKLLDISPDVVEKILKDNPTSRYYLMKDYRELDGSVVEKFESYKEKLDKDVRKNIKGIHFEEEYKRKYPYSTVACDVIGFCSDTNKGAWGIENTYNDLLNGTNGRQYGYYDSELNLVKTIKAATNGYTVKSTVDINVQGVMEQHIQRFMKTTGAKRIACLLMDPTTGGIIAMGSNEMYDLNNPGDLTVAYTKDEIAKMNDQDQVEARSRLWRNFCISDSYEPGSTFKALTVSACLDEGKTSDKRFYNCDGGQQVADRYIKCVAHSYGGHGSISLGQALMVSCNDVMMQLVAGLGKEKFLDYMDAFGIGRKTGIDLPGEASGTVFDSKSMGPVQLATSSFGQSQTVTMVQMAAAFSSIVNGGNYYCPHVVEEVTSESGALIWSGNNSLESKVITEHTSKLLRQYLYKTVEEGTANPASVKGYKVGGKTGTAEKLPRGSGKYLVSFIGCVPADHPRLVSYVVVDEPDVADQAHSTYATQFSSSLMKDVLPLLEIYPDQSATAVKTKKLKLPSTNKRNLLKIEVPKGGFLGGEDEIASQDAEGETAGEAGQDSTTAEEVSGEDAEEEGAEGTDENETGEEGEAAAGEDTEAAEEVTTEEDIE